MMEWRINTPLRGTNGAFELDVDIQLATSQLIGLYGPSGAGKTTLLRILAGLYEPKQGLVRFAKETWLDTHSGIKTPPQKRRIGFVFQDYALFPNMTVIKNLQYAQQAGQDPELVVTLLDLMELTALSGRYPHQLSSGQQQRVALARALVPEPQLLLLDEPFSALDGALRHKLGQYLRLVHERYALTTVLVSHDLLSLSNYADQVLQLTEGRLRKVNLAEDLNTTIIHGSITSIESLGQRSLVSIQTNDGEVKIFLSEEQTVDFQLGQEISLHVSLG